MKYQKEMLKMGVIKFSRKFSTGKSRRMSEEMDVKDAKQDDCDGEDADVLSSSVVAGQQEDHVSRRVAGRGRPSSSSSSDQQEDKGLSDANSKATDAAANLKQKLRSLSPAKRRLESDGKEKGNVKKGKRIAQLMSGASFKTKCALFKKVFKDLAAEEILIIDYSCALQRDILVHGRIYLSQNWLCFYSNIFGWETVVTINWHEITAITKEKTARVIPNAIRIRTSGERYFFTSFVSRDSSYTALFRVWQNALLGQPSDALELRRLCRRFRKHEASDSLDGLPDEAGDVDETGDEATEHDHETQSLSQSEISQDNPVDEQNNKTKITVIPPTPPIGVEEDNLWLAEPENSDIEKCAEKSHESKRKSIDNASDESSRSPSPILRRAENLLAFARRKKKLKKNIPLKLHSLLPAPDVKALAESENEDKASSSDATAEDPNDNEVICPCIGNHVGTEYCVEEFDFDVDALFEHLFSSDSDVMKQVHESRKMLNPNYHEITKNEDGSTQRFLTYILTLNYTIGPKHAETTVKQIFHKDNTPGSFYVIETEVFNKGIPYADSFHVFSLYCLTRLAGNRCKMRIHSEIRYTKSVMGIAKNMIQRNSDQAFIDYFKHLALVLREKSEAKPKEISKRRKGKRQNLKEEVTRENELKEKTDEAESVIKFEPMVRRQSTANSVFQMSRLKPHVAFAVSFLLILLLMVNIYLFFRVYQLENFAIIGKDSDCISLNAPVTNENWQKLLKTQRKAHELEVKRLKDVIGGTITLIKQVEKSIQEIYGEMDQNIPK